MGAYQPINIFLKQEIDRMQKVIAAVRNTLVDLKLAIDGTIIMNETLRDALDCMYDARIPAHWLKVCGGFSVCYLVVVMDYLSVGVFYQNNVFDLDISVA